MNRLTLVAAALTLAACQDSINAFPADGGSCPSGQLSCAGTCVNPVTDDAHCGGCSTACSSTQACGGATCSPKNCTDFTCGAGQVCPGGSACVDKTCVAVNCPAAQICVAGQCKSITCGGTSCAAGLACVNAVCTDLNCQGVTCPSGKTCRLGACVAAGAGAVQDFSSGGALGSQQQTNATHINRAVLGEPTPPIDGVRQSNGRNSIQGGVITGLQKP